MADTVTHPACVRRPVQEVIERSTKWASDPDKLILADVADKARLYVESVHRGWPTSGVHFDDLVRSLEGR